MFNKGDKVRALKNVKRDGFTNIEHYGGDIMTVRGVSENNLIWFRADMQGAFDGKYFELVERNGVKVSNEPDYEIY